MEQRKRPSGYNTVKSKAQLPSTALLYNQPQLQSQPQIQSKTLPPPQNKSKGSIKPKSASLIITSSPKHPNNLTSSSGEEDNIHYQQDTVQTMYEQDLNSNSASPFTKSIPNTNTHPALSRSILFLHNITLVLNHISKAINSPNSPNHSFKTNELDLTTNLTKEKTVLKMRLEKMRNVNDALLNNIESLKLGGSISTKITKENDSKYELEEKCHRLEQKNRQFKAELKSQNNIKRKIELVLQKQLTNYDHLLMKINEETNNRQIEQEDDDGNNSSVDSRLQFDDMSSVYNDNDINHNNNMNNHNNLPMHSNTEDDGGCEAYLTGSSNLNSYSYANVNVNINNHPYMKSTHCHYSNRIAANQKMGIDNLQIGKITGINSSSSNKANLILLKSTSSTRTNGANILKEQRANMNLLAMRSHVNTSTNRLKYSKK